MQKRKRFYKLGEVVWVKELKKTAVVKALDTTNYTVKVQLKDGTIGEYKLWEINKLRRNKKVHKELGQKREPLKVKIKYFHDDLERIEKLEVGDWIDLRAAEDVTLKQGEFALIPLGVAMELPRGYEAHIAPRSSTFKYWGIIQVNSVGVIDESFNGNNDEWKLPVLAMRDTEIKKGDRITQFRIMRKMPKVEFVEVESLGNSDRGGFGHTGKN